MFTAADFVAYLRRAGVRDDTPAPGGVVLCYQRSLYDYVLRSEGLEPSRRDPEPMEIRSRLAAAPRLAWTVPGRNHTAKGKPLAPS